MISSLSELLLTNDELCSHRYLSCRKHHSSLRDFLGNALKLEHHPTRLHYSYPTLWSPFAFSHPGLGRLRRNRLIGEDTNPNLPTTLHMTSHCHTSGLDLPDEAPAADLDLPADFDLSLDDESPAQPAVEADSFAAQLDEVTAELDQLSTDLDEPQDAPLAPADGIASELEGDDDFDFLSGTDETATKLDLARAYIDMGDTEGARDILDEVVAEGSDAQQQEAREMIAKLV